MKTVSNILQINLLHFEHIAYFRWWLLLLALSVAKAGFQLSSSSGIAFHPWTQAPLSPSWATDHSEGCEPLVKHCIEVI